MDPLIKSLMLDNVRTWIVPKNPSDDAGMFLEKDGVRTFYRDNEYLPQLEAEGKIRFDVNKKRYVVVGE